MSSLHELKSLIACYHPLITVETVEEVRLEELLVNACEELDLPLFNWSATSGLCKHPNDRAIMAQTNLALGALQHMEMLGMRGVFFLKDLPPHFSDHQVLRQLRETVEKFHASGSTIVLSSAKIDLPVEIETVSVPYDLKLPGARELGRLLDATVNSLRRRDPQLVKC